MWIRIRSRKTPGIFKRVAKVAFTGETTTGRLIMQYASQNLIPVTLELGGKSPNVFFENVLDSDDAFFDKCLEGFTMFALNQGEVCTCPSRALIQESIYDKFMEKALKRVSAIKQGNPLEMDTMIGAQASTEQMEKISSYLKLGKDEGADVLAGGNVKSVDGLAMAIILNRLYSKEITKCVFSKKKFLVPSYP